jgi:hypothetical protein
MVSVEKDKVDYLSNVFMHLPTETKDRVLEKARALLSIQDKDECPVQEKNDSKKKQIDL